MMKSHQEIECEAQLRSRASGWLGLGLLLAGLGSIAGVHLWHATRTFVPLDIPVSLSRGHFQTGEFLINVEALYSVTIEFEPSAGAGQIDCEQRDTFVDP
jgi:hypothetical protein